MATRRAVALSAVDTGPSRLLRVKMRAPLKPDHYVRRPRLHRLLNEVVHAPVTLVVAPAGAGKTSLLSGWAAESDAPTCWLTVDETDQDVVQLWSGIIGTLETVAPGCTERAHSLLRHPEDVLAAIDQLTDDLNAELTTPRFLVLDDLHLVDADEAVAASLAQFVQQIPPPLHAILASRRVPRLPLHRLRARGSVGEVHFAELRFSPGESAKLLTSLAPSMADDQVSAASAKAEGWAAGLQLAALAARSARAVNEEEPRDMAIDLLVHDYVWQEVLGREDPELVGALSNIAVVERADAGLASALTGRSDADDLLLRAEERGLFVSRLGPEGWFEIHAQLRNSLLTEMARTSPGQVMRQHARAARWFEASNEVAQALEHWLLAGQPGRALRLLAASQSELYDTGREATIKRAIAAIPPESAAANLQAMIDFTWCHLLVDRRRFVELVDHLTWWIAHERAEPRHRGRVEILASIASMVGGEFRAGGQLARDALTVFGDSWLRDPLGRFGWNLIAREIAMSESWDDGAEQVREARHHVHRDPQRRAAFEGTRALGKALAGWPVDALQVTAGARGPTPVDTMTNLHAELALAEAMSHRETGDRAHAERELEVLADSPAQTMLYCRLLALTELAQLLLDSHDLEGSRRRLKEAEDLVKSESFGPDVRQWVALAGTRLALAADDVESAQAWAASIDDPFWGPVSRARLHLAAGSGVEALGLLETATARCPRHEVVLGLLRAQSVDDHDDAVALAGAAVERAAANGLLQTVVSEGGPAMQLVERSAWRVPQPWMERLRRSAAGNPVWVLPPNRERLTDRERDVLRFLPSRLTIGEIADELYISANTMKFHLKVIYRKLGVNSRAEAADIARGLGPTGHPYNR